MCGYVQYSSAGYRSTDVLAQYIPVPSGTFHNPHDLSRCARKQWPITILGPQVQSQTQTLLDGERSHRNQAHEVGPNLSRPRVRLGSQGHHLDEEEN